MTIVSFFIAHMIWTPLIAKHLGSIRETRNAVIWVTAVFGTWMITLVPMIIVMYSKVDKVYEDARIRREKAAKRFRTLEIDQSKRLLAQPIQSKIKDWPIAIDGGHLVTLILKDGRQIPHVFVANQKEILGIYDQTEYSFEAKDVEDIEPTDLNQLPHFFETNWLRLDGVKAPE